MNENTQRVSSENEEILEITEDVQLPDEETTETSEVETENAEQKDDKKEKKNWKETLFKDLRDILIIVCSFMLVYVLFFRVVVVVGDSMNDTLVDGDRLLLISNLIYGEPERGDVIVASEDGFRNGEPIIKRIIATEGQTVDIDFSTGKVMVDGVVLDEPYISSPTIDNGGMTFPMTVPEGCVFVMGDNRCNSLDSRSTQIGCIDERDIVGRAIFILIPGSDDEHSFDLSRIGGID